MKIKIIATNSENVIQMKNQTCLQCLLNKCTFSELRKKKKFLNNGL